MGSQKISIYIGTTKEQKERRVAALEKLARVAGYDSISAWLIAQADEESKMYTITQENLDNPYQTKWEVARAGGVATGLIELSVEGGAILTASLYRATDGAVTHYPHDATLSKGKQIIGNVDPTQIKIEQARGWLIRYKEESEGRGMLDTGDDGWIDATGKRIAFLVESHTPFATRQQAQAAIIPEEGFVMEAVQVG